MRSLILVSFGLASLLLTGSGTGSARADDGAHIALDWTAQGISGGATSASKDVFGSDLQSRLPGFDLRFGLLEDDALPPALTPYSSLDTVFEKADFLSTTVALASDFHLRLSEAESRPDGLELPLSDPTQLQLSRADGTRTLLAGADWDFASWGGLGIAVSRADSNATFDLPARLGLSGSTTMLAVSAHLNFGDGWVTSVSYDEGRTQLDLQPSALTLAGDEKDGRGFGVAVAKNDIFGGDAFGISLVRSAQPSDSVLLAPQISLSSATPETDFQLDYETSFDGNITLQANAGYQMNVAGQNGAKAISVLSRAKINF